VLRQQLRQRLQGRLLLVDIRALCPLGTEVDALIIRHRLQVAQRAGGQLAVARTLSAFALCQRATVLSQRVRVRR
jgi:hypothetical protein